MTTKQKMLIISLVLLSIMVVLGRFKKAKAYYDVYQPLVSDEFLLHNVYYDTPPTEHYSLLQTFTPTVTDWDHIIISAEGTPYDDYSHGWNYIYLCDEYNHTATSTSNACQNHLVKTYARDEYYYLGNQKWLIPNSISYQFNPGQEYALEFRYSNNDEPANQEISIYYYWNDNSIPNGDLFYSDYNSGVNTWTELDGDLSMYIETTEYSTSTQPLEILFPTENQFLNSTTTDVYGNCILPGNNRIKVYSTTTQNLMWDTATSTYNISCDIINQFNSEVTIDDYVTTYIYAIDLRYKELQDQGITTSTDLYWDMVSVYYEPPLFNFDYCSPDYDANIFYEAIQKAVCWLFIGNAKERLETFNDHVDNLLVNKIPTAYFYQIKEQYENTATSTQGEVTIDFNAYGFGVASTTSTTLENFTWTIFDFDNPGWTTAHWQVFDYVENYLLPGIVAIWAMSQAIYLFKKVV